ncbi:MAG: FtsX-like permease family protein [Treponemataceae bacterium]|nr:FtsX-like permease family protein [Treponemataceae bacterium]
MNFKSSFLFSRRILFSKSSGMSVAKKSLAGAVLCIGISLVPLVTIITISNGMMNGITERLVSLSSSHLEAVCYSKNAQLLEDAALAAKRIPGISVAYPMISCPAMAMSGKNRCGVTLRAIPKNVFEEDASYKKLFFTEDGSIADFAAGEKGALIGKGISERLGVKAGDTIRVVNIISNPGKESDSDSSRSSISIRPSISSYKIKAVISCGYQELDSLWLFIDFEDGKKIMGAAQTMNAVMIETADAFSAELPSLQKKVQDLLGGAFRVYRWDQLNRAQYENFSSTKILLVFIQLLIVLVACVNISSALIMLVLERRREIAILKSLGASNGGISASFLLVGISCGIAGLLFGIPLGLFLSVNINGLIHFSEKAINFLAQGLYFLAKGDIMNFREIHLLDEAYYLKEIPVEIPFGELFFIGFLTLGLSLLASLLPARKAGKQRPLEILRTTR